MVMFSVIVVVLLNIIMHITEQEKIILIRLMAHIEDSLILLWLLGTISISVQCVDLKKSAAYRFIILMRIDITLLLII